MGASSLYTCSSGIQILVVVMLKIMDLCEKRFHPDHEYPVNFQASMAVVAMNTLTEQQRTQILDKVAIVVEQRFYDPHWKATEWRELARERSQDIIHTPDEEHFEQGERSANYILRG